MSTSAKPSALRLVSAAALCLAVCLLLRVCYQSAAGYFTLPTFIHGTFNHGSLPLDTWQAAAVINAMVVLLLLAYRPSKEKYAYGLASAICAVIVLAFPAGGLLRQAALLCICVPIIEESLFRQNISAALRRSLGQKAGLIYSLGVFCLCHNYLRGFSLNHLSEFIAFFGLGVFILGLILELSWQRWRSMVVQVSVHGLANALALMTVMLPTSWKAWLSPFLVQL